jgi:hypothetical protein
VRRTVKFRILLATLAMLCLVGGACAVEADARSDQVEKSASLVISTLGEALRATAAQDYMAARADLHRAVAAADNFGRALPWIGCRDNLIAARRLIDDGDWDKADAYLYAAYTSAKQLSAMSGFAGSKSPLENLQQAIKDSEGKNAGGVKAAITRALDPLQPRGVEASLNDSQREMFRALVDLHESPDKFTGDGAAVTAKIKKAKEKMSEAASRAAELMKEAKPAETEGGKTGS